MTNGSLTGPPRGERAPRVETSSTVFGPQIVNIPMPLVFEKIEIVSGVGFGVRVLNFGGGGKSLRFEEGFVDVEAVNISIEVVKMPVLLSSKNSVSYLWLGVRV